MAQMVRRERGQGLAGMPGVGVNPFRLLQDMLTPFGDELDQMVARPGLSVFMPSFDVAETGEAYLLKADLPGVREQDVQVTVTGNRITISGKREEQPAEDQRYYVSERPIGTFSRTFVLPEDCDPQQVQAELRDGVLTVRVPKRPEAKPRKVEIAGAESSRQLPIGGQQTQGKEATGARAAASGGGQAAAQTGAQPRGGKTS